MNIDSPRLTARVSVQQGSHFAAYKDAERRVIMQMGMALVEHLLAHKGEIVAYRARADWQPDYNSPFYAKQDEYRIDARIVAVVHEKAEPVYVMGSLADDPAPYEVLRVVPDPKPIPTPARLQDMRAGLLVKELWRQFRAFMDRQEACSYTRPQSLYPNEEWFLRWK